MENLKEINERLQKIEALLLTQKTVLSFDEGSTYTGLSKSHLYKMTSTGGIPCYKPHGKNIYFDKQEVDSWLLQNRKATMEELDNLANTIVTLNKTK